MNSLPRWAYPARFLSTHSVRSATVQLWYNDFTTKISIHALRKECDLAAKRHADCLPISIHALRKECDVKAQ